MPRGKELEQLPMSNIAPSAGLDLGPLNRSELTGISGREQPHPSSIKSGNKDKK